MTNAEIAERARFEQWKRRYAPSDSGEDYDLLAAFRAGVVPDESGHWPDRFKKPNHPTFSTESIYAKGENAALAGTWDGQRFTPSMVKRAALEIRATYTGSPTLTNEEVDICVAAIILGAIEESLQQEPQVKEFSQCDPLNPSHIVRAFYREPSNTKIEESQVQQEPPRPIPMTIYCPACQTLHIDEGEWATRPHKTHQCQKCKLEWRPFPYATVGVEEPSAPQQPQKVRTRRDWAKSLIEYVLKHTDDPHGTEEYLVALLKLVRESGAVQEVSPVDYWPAYKKAVERISELEKELAAEQRRSNSLLRLGAEWLLKQSESLERDHVECVLRDSVSRIYGEEGK